MLTKVEIFGLRSLAPTLPLVEGGAAGNDPIQLLDVVGLEPVKAEITTSPYGAYDGDALVGSSVGKRNIVMKFGLSPDWHTQTVGELRQLLYNYFMPKLNTRLRFTSSYLPVCQIDGIVESIEPNIFAQDPQVAVSIICPSPYFVAMSEETVTGLTSDGTQFTTIQYPGSVPTGFNLKVTRAIGTPGKDIIQLILQTEYTPVVFRAKGLLTPTDRFEMSTVPGRKYTQSVSITTGVITNELNSVAIDEPWPQLFPTENRLAIFTPVPNQDWELSYLARFGGL